MKKIYIYLIISAVAMLSLILVKGDLETLDSKFFYLKSFIDPFFESIGEDGRQRYVYVNIVDFIFIGSFTMTLVEVYKEFYAKDEMYKAFLWIPILYCLVDSVETGIILYINQSFPIVNETLKIALMIATPAKWFFVLSSLLIIVNGYLLKLYLQKTGSD